VISLLPITIRNFSRISISLCLNFFDLTNVRNTTFGEIQGYINLSIFGPNQVYIFSIILVIMVLFNFFDIYRRILTILGFDFFEFQEN